MITMSDKTPVWFGRGGKQLMFYPFGTAGDGYRVPGERYDEIANWTFWRAQLPVILWFLGFVPLVDIWAPTLSGAGRLDVKSGALALLILTASAWILAWIINRVIYFWLLRHCPKIDRAPTRLEKLSCTKQFGPSLRNIAFLCMPVATLGILASALTMLLGAVREDIPMWGLGLLVSLVFWHAFGRELFA